ncbi:hypothetical protein B0H34DRAFT_385155 [Crassisporium funariophilum]|nr:hypothetical protein B0H34DRAFT_385155 [Crassisporium funariophilum]
MVKSKSKGFKVKEYKVPKEKFLVVVNAWGLSDNFLPSDFNHIGAWFEIMLQDNYPGTRVNAIFYQRTHKNIIVELPSNVDITRYLGAHHYSKFLRYPPNDPRIAYLYEYRYSTFGNPGNKNWSDVSPTYQSIPSGIPIIYPYPSPLPAPNPSSDVPYARSISADLHNQLVLAQTLANIAADLPPLPAEPNLGQKSQRSPSTPTSSLPKQIVQSDRDARPTPAPTPDKGKNRQVEPPTPAERSDTSSSLFTPYVPPSHYSAITGGSTSRHSEINPPPNIKKMDPYEEAEVAEALLRSLSPVKRDEADEFLRSFSLPGTTREEDNELVDSPMSSKDPTNGSLVVDEEEDYKPSADLMELLNSLPPEANMVESFFAEPMIEEGTSVKAEPVETVPCGMILHISRISNGHQLVIHT